MTNITWGIIDFWALAKENKNPMEKLPDNQQYTNRFEIPSSSGKQKYTIAQNKKTQEWSCSCRGWTLHRDRHCKHIKAIKEELAVIAPQKGNPAAWKQALRSVVGVQEPEKIKTEDVFVTRKFDLED